MKLNALVALFSVAALAAGTAVFAPVAFADKGKPAAPLAQKAKLSPATLTGTWAIDKTHTDITFAVKHLGVSKTRGKFKDFDGTITVDGAKPENSSVNFVIKVDSITTDNDGRDGHLKGKDFFDAATYPEITFKSTRVARKGNNYTVTGNFTLHGVTKPIALTFTPSDPITGPDKKLHSGLETRTRIDRRDYGLTWNGLIEGTQAVGNEVDIEINLEVIKQ